MSLLNIPDDVLREAGISEQDALLELACRLFEAGKLALFSAARLAGIGRNAMEDALLERGIAIYRPGVQDLADDLAALDRLGV